MIRRPDHHGSWLTVDREPGPHQVSQDGALGGGAPRGGRSRSAATVGTVTAAGTELTLRHPIERFTLENGLRVVLAPDRSVPVVAVSVYYDVGMRNEPEGRTGFAHLFEHLMFQG